VSGTPTPGGPDDGSELDRTLAWRPSGGGANESAGPAPKPTEPPAAPLPQIPGITLIAELARGGMGVVYRGRQDYLDREVAVKLLAPELGGDVFAARFRREAKILAGVKHPHIVACHAAGTTEAGQSYLVMEFVAGPNLKSRIAERGPLPVAAALRLTKALGTALGYAHQQGIIHRDVKCENILLESVLGSGVDLKFPFVPKLVDLGLARMTYETAGLGLTSPGSVMGTPATMSPEQFDEPDAVDFRTDIYGLGCVLYEMLVGAPAYPGTRLSEIVTQKRQPRGPDPCLAVPSLPAAVGALVQTLLAADRNERPASYKALDEQLQALLAALPAAGPQAAAPTRPPAATNPPLPLPSFPPTAVKVDAGTGPGPVPSAPGSTPPTKPPGKGLLRTAEIDFLAEGLQPAAGAPAFSAGAEDADEASTQRAPSPATAPPTVPPSTPAAARGPRVGMIAAGLVLVALGGAGVWFVLRAPDDPAAGRSADGAEPRLAATPEVSPAPAAAPPPREPEPATPPAPNLPPTNVRIAGPVAPVALMKPFELELLATDPEGDGLACTWSTDDEQSVLLQPKGTKTTVRLADGLPGVAFVVHAEVSDGRNPPVRVDHTVVVGDIDPDFGMQDFLVEAHRWQVHAGDGTWLPLVDPQDPKVACKTSGGLNTLTTTSLDDRYWLCMGGLESNHLGDVYARIGVRVESGDRGWAIDCARTGAEGRQWSLELVQAERRDGVWHHSPLAERQRAEWDDGDGSEDPFGTFLITRKANELTLVGGENGTKGKVLKVELPTDAPPPVVAFYVEGGRGVFHSVRMQ
jgi:serine/threonine protein kinase